MSHKIRTYVEDFLDTSMTTFLRKLISTHPVHFEVLLPLNSRTVAQMIRMAGHCAQDGQHSG